MFNPRNTMKGSTKIQTLMQSRCSVVIINQYKNHKAYGTVASRGQNLANKGRNMQTSLHRGKAHYQDKGSK